MATKDTPRCDDPWGSKSGGRCPHPAKWLVPNGLFRNVPPKKYCGYHARGQLIPGAAAEGGCGMTRSWRHEEAAADR